MPYAKSLMMGILAATGALILETLISMIFPDAFSPENIYLFGSVISLAILALIEEISIFFMVFKIKNDFGNSQSILGLSFLCGIGFALFEIGLRFLGENDENFLSPAYMGIFLVHIFTAGLFGFFLGRKSFSPNYSLFLLVLASLAHFAYNYLIISLG
jgi:hypothetical protein